MIFETDTVINESAFFYRYSSRKQKIEIFPDTKIIPREFGALDIVLAFPPGNSEGIKVGSKSGEVANRTSSYFYIWSEKELSDRKLKALFLRAARKYFGNKIHNLNIEADTYRMKLDCIEKDLKSE